MSPIGAATTATTPPTSTPTPAISTTNSPSAATAVAPPATATATVAGRTPGQELVGALGAEPLDVGVELPLSLPTAFPFFAARPRYTVRHLLSVAAPSGHHDDAGGDAEDESESERRGVPYIREPAAARAPAESGTSYAASPEAAFDPSVEHARLTWVTATVPVPDGLTRHPELLAAYVDRRVIVRLCTVENQVLLHGSADGAIPGLLDIPGRRAISSMASSPGAAGLAGTAGSGAGGAGAADVAELARAAALVEETGGSCDGIVVHPDVYWRLVAGGGLTRLNEVGVRVSRTRMIARDRALLGDFRAVATLLDENRSRLTLRRGAGPGGTDVIEAAHRIGLAVHLPQHLVLLDLGTGDAA